MSEKIVNVKASVPATALGGYGTVDLEDKATRTRLADAALNQLRTALEGAARTAGYGVSVKDFEGRYTRKGNVKASFVAVVPAGTSDRQVQDRAIQALNPLSQRAGASNLDVQVADLDA